MKLSIIFLVVPLPTAGASDITLSHTAFEMKGNGAFLYASSNARPGTTFRALIVNDSNISAFAWCGTAEGARVTCGPFMGEMVNGSSATLKTEKIKEQDQSKESIELVTYLKIGAKIFSEPNKDSDQFKKENFSQTGVVVRTEGNFSLIQFSQEKGLAWVLTELVASRPILVEGKWREIAANGARISKWGAYKTIVLGESEKKIPKIKQSGKCELKKAHGKTTWTPFAKALSSVLSAYDQAQAKNDLTGHPLLAGILYDDQDFSKLTSIRETSGGCALLLGDVFWGQINWAMESVSAEDVLLQFRTKFGEPRALGEVGHIRREGITRAYLFEKNEQIVLVMIGNDAIYSGYFNRELLSLAAQEAGRLHFQSKEIDFQKKQATLKRNTTSKIQDI